MVDESCDLQTLGRKRTFMAQNCMTRTSTLMFHRG